MDVSREKLDAYAAMVRAESERQNLVSKSTLDHFWDRHVEDGLQLIPLFPAGARSLLDIGSGAGLPGMILAIATDLDVTLCEPRALRVDFLTRVKDALGLDNVTIAPTKVERVRGRFDLITARAVATLGQLFDQAGHCAHNDTIWVLPKGQSALDELEVTRKSWQGAFRTVPSATNPEARIVIASQVGRRGGR